MLAGVPSPIRGPKPTFCCYSPEPLTVQSSDSCCHKFLEAIFMGGWLTITYRAERQRAQSATTHESRNFSWSPMRTSYQARRCTFVGRIIRQDGAQKGLSHENEQKDLSALGRVFCCLLPSRCCRRTNDAHRHRRRRRSKQDHDRHPCRGYGSCCHRSRQGRLCPGLWHP